MKKLMMVLAIAALLLATVGVSVAMAGQAGAKKRTVVAHAAGYDKAGARKRMVQLAHWKAACGQGYWRCAQGYIVHGPYGPAHADPEWTGTVLLFRHKKKSVSWQTCNVEVWLNHDESTEELTIDCEYALTAPDRSQAASWS